MMVSHMQAAARHLDDGSEHLARTMDRLAREMGPAAGDRSGRTALPGDVRLPSGIG
jgi:hypothetical protein